MRFQPVTKFSLFVKLDVRYLVKSLLASRFRGTVYGLPFIWNTYTLGDSIRNYRIFTPDNDPAH